MLGRGRRDLSELSCQADMSRARGRGSVGALGLSQPRVPTSALCLGGLVMSKELATERLSHLALRLSGAS